jgi:hypothetical protein
MKTIFENFNLIVYVICGFITVYAHHHNPNGTWVAWLMCSIFVVVLHLEYKISKLGANKESKKNDEDAD